MMVQSLKGEHISGICNMDIEYGPRTEQNRTEQNSINDKQRVEQRCSQTENSNFNSNTLAVTVTSLSYDINEALNSIVQQKKTSKVDYRILLVNF